MIDQVFLCFLLIHLVLPLSRYLYNNVIFDPMGLVNKGNFKMKFERRHSYLLLKMRSFAVCMKKKSDVKEKGEKGQVQGGVYSFK